MRRRSLVGPVFLILIGALFLADNLWPNVPVFQLVSTYWPFLLIGWGVLRLMEILTAAARSKPLPRTGLTGGEVVIIVFVCLIGSALFAGRRGHLFHVGPWAARSLEMFGEQYDYPIAAQQPTGQARRIVFNNLKGNLRITGNDGDQIKITGRKTIRAFSKSDADQTDRQTQLDIIAEGDRLEVRTNQERASSNRRISADLEIAVPRAVSIETHANYGDFDITDIAGGVEITSGNAGVRLNKIGSDARIDLGRSDIVRAIDVKGNVDLMGRGSDVELENIQGQVTINGSYSGALDFKNLARALHFESRSTDLRVQSVPGRISIDLGRITGKNMIGPVRLIAKSRDIELDNFTESLELETERGDIELRPEHVPLPKIEVRSRTGNVALLLPQKANFELEATTEHGEARNDFGPPIRAVAEGRGASLKGSVGQGPSIKITTQRGFVAVRRAGSEAKL